MENNSVQNVLVSVVMPAYNAEKYIAQSIESVLMQSYMEFELLVINDASTDGTEKIVREFMERDGRIKLLQNAHEKGVAGGINTGLENAKGKYIARADADDLNRPYRFARQVKYLNEHPEISILSGGYAPFNVRGHRMDVFRPTSSLEIAWRFLTNTFFCHPAVMFRREVYETLGGYPNVEAEDFAYFSGVIRKFRGTNLKEVLVDYRESLTNRSMSAADRIAKSVRVQAEKNYRYYTGGDQDFDLFFNYQNGNKLSSSNWSKVMGINKKIMHKIAADYGVKKMSWGYVRTWGIILIGDIKKILSTPW